MIKHPPYSRLLACALLVALALAGAALGQERKDQPAAPGQDPKDRPAAPKIAIQTLEYNFGEVKKGENAQHIFTFKNEGKADLEIKNVAPS